jgi:signal transduction histidine kinase
MPSLKFTVDAELLRELGQRLVGKPHVALAELVKNGYDADATRIVIRFALEQDHIDVRDNGHGMTLSEFRDFWMRVGTTHKVGNTSRRFHRNMTGSKGVGRLSAQFLGDKLRIISVPEEGPWLSAEVDWTQAASAGDLTEAEVVYEMHENEKPFAQGTQITIGGLRDEWSDPRAIQDLAAEVWWLQPPFRAPIRSPENGDPGCKIEFRSTQEEFRAAFDQQMSAIMDIWTARIVGRNENGTVHMSLEFAGEPPNKFEYRIAELPHNRTGEASSPTYDPETNLNDGEFEIRIYKLQYRQPHGIKVDDAREYFWRYGGVHVYDGGFRLPYYGDKLNDWLGIEQDHSHRRFLSELLPESIQQSYQDTARLRFLPTLARIFGVVRVDTSREPNLEIMITRDRLADTRALQDLTKMVRWAIDMYAYEEARRQYEEKRRRAESLPLPEAMDRMRLFLDEVKVSLPGEARQRADEVWRQVTEAWSARNAWTTMQVALLGPLATAGMSALALQHELAKQLLYIDSFVDQLEGLASEGNELSEPLMELGARLRAWADRARGTSAVFSYLLDAENVENRRRFYARDVLEEVVGQTKVFARGISIDLTGVSPDVLLPRASLIEWGAILQNVLINAYSALLDQDERKVSVRTERGSGQIRLLIQDTGSGVDLADSERLFEPFVRGREISDDRIARGYGGGGLGLTIVKLLADRIGCEVRFVEPDPGFATAFSIQWREPDA